MNNQVSSMLVPPVNALVAVERAEGELRRGWPVVLAAEDGGLVLVLAAEGAGEGNSWLARIAPQAAGVAITGPRAVVLGLTGQDGGPSVLVTPRGPLTPAWVRGVADPLAAPAAGLEVLAAPAWADAALALVKLARLLPAAVVAPVAVAPSGLVRVNARAVLDYPVRAATMLRKVAEARVPLADAEETRVIAFRPEDGGLEHLAIILGEPDGREALLTRLHSECFTGDLLGSLKCDCGDQLRGAIRAIAAAGGGVLLYLAQEGRGIGLVNKLRAYELQAAGYDTLDANGQLGFDDDERIYQPAAEMLKLLGIAKVRLLTNNPAKVQALSRHGIEVAERVPHVFPATKHNAHYLFTKAVRGGHLF